MMKLALNVLFGFVVTCGVVQAAEPDFVCRLPKACESVTNVSFSAPSTSSAFYVMTVACQKEDGKFGMYTTNWTSGWALFGAGRVDIPNYVELVPSENDDALTCN